MKPVDSARHTLRLEVAALKRVAERIDESFDVAANIIRNSDCVITTGVGKSGIVAQKIAATFRSLGAPSTFIHPTEALHGDYGILRKAGQALIVVSKSGETREVIEAIENLPCGHYVPIIALVGEPESTIGKRAGVAIDCSVQYEEGGPPTASATAAMAMGDALAVAVGDLKGFKVEDYKRLHPGGER